MPRIDSRLRYVDHLAGRGRDLFREACRHDLEGIVGKWAHGPYYDDGVSTSWIKVKNPDDTRSVGRRELFERGPSMRRHRREFRAPILRLQPSDVRAKKGGG